MDWLLKALVIVSIVLIGFISARPVFTSIFYRRLWIIAVALVLAYLSIFEFHKPKWNWEGAEDLLAIGKAKDIDAYRNIWENFVLVDNSRDKRIVKDPDTDVDDSLGIVITHRDRMARFINILVENDQLVDGLVYDVALETGKAEDSLLWSGLKFFARSSKLVLADARQYAIDSSIPFRDQVFGQVEEQTNGKLFTSHYILRDSLVSLPYRIYQLTHGVQLEKASISFPWIEESYGQGKRHAILQPFFPPFRILDEQLLWDGFSEDIKDSLVETFTSGRYGYYLGQTISPGGTAMFIDQLKSRRKKGRKNILFVGSFRSGTEDVHQTLYKELHGPVILLNIYDALVRGKHHFNPWIAILILMGFVVIVFVLTHRALGLPWLFERKLNEDLKQIMPDDIGEKAKDLLKVLFTFIVVDQLHFTLLLLMAWLVFVFTGRFFNILAVSAIMALLFASLKYVREKSSNTGK